MTEYSPAKTGEYPRIFPNFQNCARCEKDLMDNKDISRHLGRKYARIFVLGHYLFLVAHIFHRASLSENCSLLGADNVRGQISEHIFAPNGDYCLYIPKSHDATQKQCPQVVHFNVPTEVIGLKQTRGIKSVTLKAAKRMVGVAVYWEE